jgi:hypothetical protein
LSNRNLSVGDRRRSVKKPSAAMLDHLIAAAGKREPYNPHHTAKAQPRGSGKTFKSSGNPT